MAIMKLLTVGEALIDWICTERGADLAAATHFDKAAGGAPFNVAVGYARLGGPAAFAGRLGDDPFGAWLGELLRAEGVDRALATVAPGLPTRMAFVTTSADGDRAFSHFSAGAADEALSAADLPLDALLGFEALVFGSLPLAVPSARAAVLNAAKRCRSRALVLFDPNARPVLWKNDAAQREAVEAGLAACTVAKLGEDELGWLTGELEPMAAAELVRARFGLHAVVVTLGAAGSLVRLAGGRSALAASFPIDFVDATGAGDGFVAGLLAALPADGWRDLDDAGWVAALRRANAVGAIACTRAGAIAALPDAATLSAFLAKQTG